MSDAPISYRYERTEDSGSYRYTEEDEKENAERRFPECIHNKPGGARKEQPREKRKDGEPESGNQ